MAIVKKYNVVAPKEITNKQTNETKTLWKPVGTLVVFEKNGKHNTVLELNFVPNQQYLVFEQKPKEQQQSAPQQHEDDSVITADDIPF